MSRHDESPMTTLAKMATAASPVAENLRQVVESLRRAVISPDGERRGILAPVLSNKTSPAQVFVQVSI